MIFARVSAAPTIAMPGIPLAIALMVISTIGYLIVRFSL
jgi:hypothetical protein